MRISDLEIFNHDSVYFWDYNKTKNVLCIGEELKYLPDYEIFDYGFKRGMRDNLIELVVSNENYNELLEVLESL